MKNAATLLMLSALLLTSHTSANAEEAAVAKEATGTPTEKSATAENGEKAKKSDKAQKSNKAAKATKTAKTAEGEKSADASKSSKSEAKSSAKKKAAFDGARLAKTPFHGPNLSGVYECKGLDSHEGEYTGTVTLELIQEQSRGNYGAYRFKLDVPGYGEYPGHGVARGKNMALYFGNTDPAHQDFGTGIAKFSKKTSTKAAAHKKEAAKEGENPAANQDGAKESAAKASKVAKTAKGKWTFTKYYYEPEFKGGNFGTELCTQR